jgi:hypothetical protein
MAPTGDEYRHKEFSNFRHSTNEPPLNSLDSAGELLGFGVGGFCDVARCFPVACEEELCFIRNLVGGKVTRVSHVLAGERNCSYRIERSAQQEPAARKKKV